MPDTKPKLNYEILAPNTIVEASFSKELDDRSVVDFTIEVSNPVTTPPNTGITLRKIEFIVPVATADADKKGALTSNPRGINPVVREPGWTLKRKQDGTTASNVIFEATPISGQFTVNPGDKESLGFRLLDVEIVDAEGKTKIDVNETADDGSVGSTSLDVRKVSPTLRIDFFRASEFEVDPVLDRDNSLTLSWATTGATEVLLKGLSKKDDDEFTKILNSNPSSVHDMTFAVHPKSTTTYTLTAKSNASDALATAQITITVKNNDAARPGTIIAWSRIFDGDTLPPAWVLCDGSTYEDDDVAEGAAKPTVTVPDLRGRFVMGAKTAADNQEPGTGSPTATLAENNIPRHNHALAHFDGAHDHTIFMDETLPSGNISGRQVGGRRNPEVITDQIELDRISLDPGREKKSVQVIGGAFETEPAKLTLRTSGGTHSHEFFGKQPVDAFDIIPPNFVLAYIIRLKPHMTKVTNP